MDVERPTSASGRFSVQTEVYTGPLDLLIDLIEKRKLLINDISVAAVTDDYMAYVATLEQNPLREIADFIVLAATLLLLKSRSLLPVLELTDAEEENIENLESRLKLYQIFRNAGKTVERLFGQRMSHERRFIPSSTPLFLTDRFTTPDALSTAMSDVLRNLPKKVEKPKVQVRKVVSLDEMIDRLHERIERQLSFTFSDFANASKHDRPVIIVGFLAVLEMVKQGKVLVRQAATYHDIEIERFSHNIPHYG